MTLYHDSFYKFVHLEDPEALAEHLKAICEQAQLKGTILLATEGINAMLAGTAESLTTFWTLLYTDSRFTGLKPKRTLCSHMPFKRLKVRVKPEIVSLGIEGVDAVSKTGVQVPPSQWLDLLAQPEVVLLDNRNSFEAKIGTFEGAIDPEVSKFRDFAGYVQSHLDQWQGKKIAMFCTGGIRCEKASAWCLDLGLDVYQLEGGIISYFAEQGSKGWQGDCFVFDDRVVLDANLQESHVQP